MRNSPHAGQVPPTTTTSLAEAGADLSSLPVRKARPSGTDLLDIMDWARGWKLCERQCHALRKHPKFPLDATVVLGPRCVRFRAAKLAEFAAALAAESKLIAEPAKLRRGRDAARVYRMGKEVRE